MQSQQLQPQQRRNPLTTTTASNVPQQQPQAQQQTPPKPPPKGSSPPLPRQNSKTTPPTPPKVIVDRHSRFQFTRVGFLGEGGFARVFEVEDPRHNRLACKVITKTSLKTKKAKTKLWAEIKIHRSLEHPNIVRFHDCFEDGENVYMTLELCPSGSLMDMLRRRRRFTEPEARFFMVQLIGACNYMHTHQVIHRDLKLGNLLLDGNMNIKVADFGLAALIENPGERKKTICGTPNYIAPEVLFDTVNGHSFEVDTWSIGVILYTIIIGRPPFQTKDVKEIYKRIRDNDYEFPIDRKIGTAVKTLIQQILTPDPSLRPTLYEILEHLFFIQGPVPSYIPSSAHDIAPDFSNITPPLSDSNLRRLRRHALLDQGPNVMPSTSSSLPQSNSSKTITSTIQQQEKEFQKAIQPGSPISALLSSARQPLVMGVPSDGMAPSPNPKESALLRKLQAAKESNTFNFYDHSKLILSSHGLLVTHIDKNYNLTRHKLSDIMAQSLNPTSNNNDPEQVRFNQKLVDKLKYCKEVLVSIKEASAGVAAKQSVGACGLEKEGKEQQAPVAAIVQQERERDRERVPSVQKHAYAVNGVHQQQQQQGLTVRASRMTLR
ncbi:Cell cycle serine/threonine-protein kinase CDC5/MSD2 [Leucoagaricus sp. SymC.cos]|nr:Cell cycle serine/threonine-protein kinase CDC5/MSD2 [Leucoagaricus sp. SymC.cos]